MLEAPKLIAAKARVDAAALRPTVMPDGFKAQVVAPPAGWRGALPRGAPGRPRRPVAEIEALPAAPASTALPTAASTSTDSTGASRCWSGRWPHLDLIRHPGLRAGHLGQQQRRPDLGAVDRQGSPGRGHRRLQEAARPRPASKTSPVAFLIVKSMLLTGFDAPVEQVLYLDRFIQDAELLQAIARVNRTARARTPASWSTTSASARTSEGARRPTRPKTPRTRSARWPRSRTSCRSCAIVTHGSVAVFAQAGIETFDTDEDIEACVEVLADEALRARFGVLLKQFLTTLDIVLPRPEALPFVADAKRFGHHPAGGRVGATATTAWATSTPRSTARRCGAHRRARHRARHRHQDPAGLDHAPTSSPRSRA